MKMGSRIIAALLAISLAGCSSVPRFAPAEPRGPIGTAAPTSASAKDETAPDSTPEQKAADGTPERPDTTEGKRSHLTELGRGIVLIGLIALLVWLHYLMVCAYCW